MKLISIFVALASVAEAAYAESRRIWLIKHSWHTGLGVEQADLNPQIWPERVDFSGRRFLEVGWGSKDFYMAKEPGVWLALKSGVVPGPSVLHVVGFDDTPSVAFPNSAVEERLLSEEQFDAVMGFVDRSFDRQGQGRSPSLGPGLYGDSRFYPATGDYHLFYTCNDWLEDALKSRSSAAP